MGADKGAAVAKIIEYERAILQNKGIAAAGVITADRAIDVDGITAATGGAGIAINGVDGGAGGVGNGDVTQGTRAGAGDKKFPRRAGIAGEVHGIAQAGQCAIGQADGKIVGDIKIDAVGKSARAGADNNDAAVRGQQVAGKSGEAAVQSQCDTAAGGFEAAITGDGSAEDTR